MPKKQFKEVALYNYGILRVPSIEMAKACPESLQTIFKAVHDSKFLQMAHFGARPEREDRRGVFDTDAAHDYDLRLKQRALELAISCCDPSMIESPEADWASDLSTHVFLPFKRKEEEKLDIKRPFHHCLACRRNFPPGSRPIINTLYTDRARAMLAAKPQRGESRRSDFELCESGEKHWNLPNLDIANQLSYHDDDSDVEGRSSIQIPDATLGLCTYNLTQDPWAQREDLMNNDMVKLFDNVALTEILRHFDLHGPYRSVSSNPFTPMFGFGLWEVKKSDAGNHTTTYRQSARKVATLLRWQRKIFDRARCEHCCPLVWFFSSVGPDWEIWGCYEIKKPRNEGYQYPMITLWRGCSEDPDSALQLLYVVDIIKFWAEYTYKPTIGACLSRLQAMKADALPVRLEDTLWKSQIALSMANTPWFFLQRRSHEASSACRSINGKLEVPLIDRPFGRRSSDQPVSGNEASPASRQSSRRRNQRNRTSVGEHYVIPEIESYNWILDRDPGHGDLLLIRIDSHGKRRRPIVFFDSTSRTVNWDDPDFNDILADEIQRHNSDVLPGFTVDKKGRNYLWNCGPGKTHLIRSDTQFCAILPLNVKVYNRQRPMPEESQLFEPLESLLGVPVLLAEIDRAYNQWCLCNCPWNEHSSTMIQCNNAKCNLGWYHMKCVGLDEDEDWERWLCDICCDIPAHERTDTILAREYNKAVEASSYRVQRTRTLRRAWNKHAWPKPDDILRKFQKVTLNLDLVKSVAHNIHRKGVERDSKPPRYWALSKHKPRTLVMASSREQQLVYHQEVADNDEDNSDDTDENGINSEDDAVSGIEDALENMSLGRISIGHRDR